MLPIVLRGATTHNLKSVSLTLNPGELIAITGPSGAGKSSLALDTLYAEGQRRFVESFSPYARQFLERMERPPCESLDPIAATIAVDRKAPIKSSRSTLATMTDLEPYLAALFACESVPTCPECGLAATFQSARNAAKCISLDLDPKATVNSPQKITVSYDLSFGDAETFLELRDSLAKEGYRRLYVEGEIRDLDEVRPSEALAVGARPRAIVDRLTSKKDDVGRLQEALESAWARGAGRAYVHAVDENKTTIIAQGLVCPKCARTFDPPAPALFSYNSALGACESCKGFGRVIEVDWNKVIPDPSKSIVKGAISAWSGKTSQTERALLLDYAKKHDIPVDVPWSALTEAQRAAVIDGEGTWDGGKFPGVKRWFTWLETRTYKMHVRVFLARYRDYATCNTCHGSRLRPSSLTYRIADRNLAEWHALTIAQVHAQLPHTPARTAGGARAREAILSRLSYLRAVGLGYLTLDRQARTLSGGEAQRAALTTALGATLTGTLFVLDEPTVGLHPTDVPPLLDVMRAIAQAGNTVVVIEHDQTIVRGAQRVVELGPGAGPQGGHVLFDGTPRALAKRKDVPTAMAWRQATERRSPRDPKTWVVIENATEHNLRGVTVSLPLGVLCAVTGPSGSGKSTLIRDILFRAAARGIGHFRVDKAGKHTAITGLRGVKSVTLVDQSPLGRTARGNAATYTKAWDRIRTRFEGEPKALAAKLTASHFSFNVDKGRCETCAGEGYETVEMQFLADVMLLCPVCRGKRFKHAVLAIHHQGRTIADVLEMTVADAFSAFSPPNARDYVLERALQPLLDVGLGYLPLGQPLSTLSGGEAQRLKLARALADEKNGALFVLDEPSAGLHGLDAALVVKALHRLVDAGASVIMVEHDTDMIRSVDWIVDLGPGGGPDGGLLVAEGTVEAVARGTTRTSEALRAFGLITSCHEALTPVAPVLAITVEGANEHNLKHVSCSIPHETLTVITGPSGSGKSSLAFDVIYAEGQRRFIETLTPYARQFLPMLPRPDVERVSGVPPTIALEQRTSRAGANSTVATVTEAAHYLRLLYAKVGDVHCPKCDGLVNAVDAGALYQRLTLSAGETRRTVYAPAVRARKGTYLDLFTLATRAGVRTARVDGVLVTIEPPPKLAKAKEHSVDLIVYYGKLAELDRATFDRALSWGNGALAVGEGAPTRSGDTDTFISTSRACTRCGTGVPEIDPRWFSFNTKQGQCGSCEGSGIKGGPAAALEGVTSRCPSCKGTRLAPLPRGVRLFDQTYPALLAKSTTTILEEVKDWNFLHEKAIVAKAPHAELLRRLKFIDQVGLGYLNLDRSAHTLSGGEMQRLRLSAQLGAGLTGALYVLDEPTIGLHPRDTDRLLKNLRLLVDTGSTVIVVEHDAEMIKAADYVVDLGPGGGRNGGTIVASGSGKSVLKNPDSPTARALAEGPIDSRPKRNRAETNLEIVGASANNLKNVTFKVPIGRMTVVAGVSGSGKSTLVGRVFYPALRRALNLVAAEPGAFKTLRGEKNVRRALLVDQAPIGRTPRSVPATFLGIFDEIRKLFASLPDAQTRGFSPARFSFNTPKGGRCIECEGQGVRISEMAFLPDVAALCETCGGARFEPRTLETKYKGLSIGDVLRLTASEAAVVFEHHRKIGPPLRTMTDLGLGYIAIGQGSNTLSGGEAQRLKLAVELTAGVAHEPTVYVLDEPTTGLHLLDVRRLVGVLEALVARGDTLVIVEHQPDVIAAADWVIELGPEAGAAGGRIVFEGPPSELRKAKTATGKVLARMK